MGHQTGNEVALVRIVVPAFERVGAGGEVYGRAYRADRSQSGRRSSRKFTRHLGNQISSHRVSSEEDLFESLAFREFFEDGAIITAHPGVVKRSEERRVGKECRSR